MPKGGGGESRDDRNKHRTHDANTIIDSVTWKQRWLNQNYDTVKQKTLTLTNKRTRGSRRSGDRRKWGTSAMRPCVHCGYRREDIMVTTRMLPDGSLRVLTWCCAEHAWADGYDWVGR